MNPNKLTENTRPYYTLGESFKYKPNDRVQYTWGGKTCRGYIVLNELEDKEILPIRMIHDGCDTEIQNDSSKLSRPCPIFSQSFSEKGKPDEQAHRTFPYLIFEERSGSKD